MTICRLRANRKRRKEQQNKSPGKIQGFFFRIPHFGRGEQN